jgi:hypothetical protein
MKLDSRHDGHSELFFLDLGDHGGIRTALCTILRDNDVCIYSDALDERITTVIINSTGG